MLRRQHTRLIFEATGSRGDVAPMLALASSLARRGYRCELLANSGYEAEAAAGGVELTAIVDRKTAFRKGEAVGFGDYLFPGLPRVLERLADASAEDTLVVNSSRLSASNLVCEQRGLPTVRVHLSPFVLRSFDCPPWPYRAHLEAPSGEAAGRQALRRLYAAMDTSPRLLAFVNARRQELSLGPVPTASHMEPHVRRHVAMFPTWFSGTPQDWPAGIELVGFPLPPASPALPSEVQDFIARHGRPIVFTTGTFVEDTDSFVALARDCCKQLHRPGIFSSVHRAHSACEHEPFLELPFVELAALLPHVDVLVHHGGIGTSARALQAGVPQIVCPLGFDQFDNAHCLRLLGVACVADRRLLDTAQLCEAIQGLLGSQVRARTEILAERTVDGLERAAQLVEAVLERDRVDSAGPQSSSALRVRAAHTSLLSPRAPGLGS